LGDGKLYADIDGGINTVDGAGHLQWEWECEQRGQWSIRGDDGVYGGFRGRDGSWGCDDRWEWELEPVRISERDDLSGDAEQERVYI
jgi:hypothetical protein